MRLLEPFGEELRWSSRQTWERGCLVFRAPGFRVLSCSPGFLSSLCLRKRICERELWCPLLVFFFTGSWGSGQREFFWGRLKLPGKDLELLQGGLGLHQKPNAHHDAGCKTACPRSISAPGCQPVGVAGLPVSVPLPENEFLCRARSTSRLISRPSFLYKS